MSKKINLGGVKLKLETVGVDEGLEKLNLIMLKLQEVKSLINEITSMQFDIKLNNYEENIIDD